MHTQSDPTALAVHPTPDVSPGSDHHRHEGSRLRLATAVMFVTDLARSIEFYQGLLGWDVTVEDDNVALLAGPEGFQMYLHRHGPRAQHPLAQIGIQYLIWTARDDARPPAGIRRAAARRVVPRGRRGHRCRGTRGPGRRPGLPR